MKNPLSKKKPNKLDQVKNIQYIVEEDLPEEIHIEATATPETNTDDAPTIGIETIKDVSQEELIEEDDDEEYVYVTPHYTMNAILITALFFIIGFVCVFVFTHSAIEETIRNEYIEAGYIQTKNAVAGPEDIMEGKTAYVNGELVTGTFTPLDTSNATATADDIMEGASAYVNGEKIYGSIQQFVQEPYYMPETKEIVIPKGVYISGSILVKGDPNLTPDSIKEGVSIFGVKGTYKGTEY